LLVVFATLVVFAMLVVFATLVVFKVLELFVTLVVFATLVVFTVLELFEQALGLDVTDEEESSVHERTVTMDVDVDAVHVSSFDGTLRIFQPPPP